MARHLIYHASSPANQQVHARAENSNTDVVLNLVGVSRSGLILECGPSALERCIPKSFDWSPRHTQNLVVLLDDHAKRYHNHVEELLCRIESVRRLSRDNFQINVQFLELTDESSRVIETMLKGEARDEFAA